MIQAPESPNIQNIQHAKTSCSLRHASRRSVDSNPHQELLSKRFTGCALRRKGHTFLGRENPPMVVSTLGLQAKKDPSSSIDSIRCIRSVT